jgi:hypothetical protein
VSRRWRISAYSAAGALVIAGVACAALVPGTTGQVLAMALIGVGLVGVVSLVFLEIGLSEDRERAARRPPPAERAARPPPPASKRPPRPARPRSLRPDRMRGRRRRLRP